MGQWAWHPSIGSSPQSIPYSTLLKELDIAASNVRELEDLIIEAIYAGIIQAKLDQRNAQVCHLSVHSHTHTHAHTVAHTYTTCTHICTHTHAYLHTQHAHTYAHTCTYALICTCGLVLTVKLQMFSQLEVECFIGRDIKREKLDSMIEKLEHW